jgi:hypothetical protein
MSKLRTTSVDQEHQHQYKMDRYGEGVTLEAAGHSHEICSERVFPATDGHVHKLETTQASEE